MKDDKILDKEDASITIALYAAQELTVTRTYTQGQEGANACMHARRVSQSAVPKEEETERRWHWRLVAIHPLFPSTS